MHSRITGQRRRPCHQQPDAACLTCQPVGRLGWRRQYQEDRLMPESTAVQGIDVHVHIATGDNLRAMQAGSTATETTTRATAARAYFGSAARMRVTADEVAEQYRSLNLLAVV